MSKPQSNSLISIDLFGTLEEATYQLGILDKDDVNLAWQSLKESSYFGPSVLKDVLHKVFPQLLGLVTIHDNELSALLESYAAGLEVTTEEALYLILMPEFLNNPHALIESISDLHLQEDMNSYKIDSSTGIHTSTIGPHASYFNKKLRTVNYKLDEGNQIFVLQTLATPLCQFSGSNDKGLSLSLVQRDANKVYQHGQPVSYVALKLLNTCNTVEEALSFLREQQLYFHWEFILKDSQLNTAVASINTREYKLISEQRIQSEEKSCPIKAHKTFQNIKNYSSLSKNKVTPLTIGFIINDYSSLSYSYFCQRDKKQYIHEVKNPFSDKSEYLQKQFKLKKNIRIATELNSLLNKAQIAFNESNEEACYHLLQLSIDHIKKNSPKNTGQLASLKLVFICCQYINESHKEVYSFLISDLKEIIEDLDEHRQGLALVLIQRLQLLLNRNINLPFKSNEHINTLTRESKMNAVKHMAVKKLTLLRPNHLDFCPIGLLY